MKKWMILFSIAFSLTLAGCATTDQQDKQTENQTETIKLDTNSSLAFSTYLASGLLTSNNTSSTMNMSYTNLSDATSETDSLLIESELDEVNIYFNKLKVFMENGVESVLNVSEQTSTMEGYDYEITYTIEDESYTIYYSLIESTEEADEDDDDDDESEFQLTGLMVIDGVNYELEGASETEEDEHEMWFETIDQENSDNYVRVEIANEDGEQKFEIETTINGITKEAEIKFEQEDNETKVELELVQNGQESYYEFKKEVEDNETIYKFEYEINGVEGEVKVTEEVDADGNTTYQYEIEEDGKTKEIDKRDPDDDDDDEDDEDSGEL